MATSKTVVTLEGPLVGRKYRVRAIKGAVVLTVYGGRGAAFKTGEVRRGDLVDEEVVVNLSNRYGVTIVAPKGGM
jgi:hypothetical protein